MSYAVDTTVSVEKTRAEIESTLARYGATRFAYATEEKRAAIMFVINNMGVRFELPLPDRREERFWKTPVRLSKRTEQEAYKEWEQACRSLWRSLFLCIKAKLEACEAKITSFEAEFLAHIVLPDGKTFGDMAIPQITAMRDSGKMPRLQIGWNP
jgi:hypothetical protein